MHLDRRSRFADSPFVQPLAALEPVLGGADALSALAAELEAIAVRAVLAGAGAAEEECAGSALQRS